MKRCPKPDFKSNAETDQLVYTSGIDGSETKYRRIVEK